MKAVLPEIAPTKSLAMKNLAVVYHSAHGHTLHVARHVAEGARSIPGIHVDLLPVEDLTPAPQRLTTFDALVFGSPTYLGGVPAPMKALMDATGRLWREQALKGRLAAGFTVSSLPAGDKQSTLLSMFVFAMQHGMVWVGNPILPEQRAGVPDEHAANRLGSWSGLMAQAAHGAPSDAFPPGDLKTARLFGANVARELRMRCAAPALEEAAA
jgi:multimeric flavodoxin WrbA